MTRTVLLLLLAVGGCGNPMNLGYDFGRAYLTSSQTQADLSRSTVAAAQYRLSGLEGTMIRLRLSVETTDAETEQSTLTTETR